MVLVLLYWLYIFFLTATFGISLISLLKLPRTNPFIIPFIGSFVITLLAAIWAIFSNLGLVFEGSLAVISIVYLFFQKEKYATYFFSLKAKRKSFPLLLKLALVAIIMFAAAQCASPPFIIDNESYYIQTIKWLDTYGYVPGLANLHYFLGQSSGWHIFQGAINLNGISLLFNDSNGLYLVLGNAYALDKLASHFKSRNLLFLAAGLLPLFNIFLFQFISAPSPDVPIYLITFIVFFEFATYYSTSESQTTPILLLFLLVLFAVFIKVFAVFLFVFPLLLYVKYPATLKKSILPICILSILTLTLFVVKNSIISGYPLYPLTIFRLSEDWVLPLTLQQYLVEATQFYGFFLSPEEYQQMTLIERIVQWVSLPKLHGLFNKLMIILLIIYPIVLKNKKLKTPFLTLYIVAGFQLLFLWLTSPQYRFFFGYIILLSCIIAAYFIKRKILIQLGLVVATSIIAIPLFAPFSLTSLTNNPFKQELSSFSLMYAIKPHPITKHPNTIYKQESIGNLTYHTPDSLDFFWATGDGELPCIQKNQLTSFKEYFELAPQMRTNTLKDGFKSVYFPNE